MAAKLIKDPTVIDKVWEQYEQVKHARKSKLLCAAFKLNEDETEIIPAGTVSLNSDSPWNEFIDLCPEQEVRWIIMLFPYKTSDGGIREKLTYMTWIPDSLKRETFKESVKVKTNGLTFGAPLSEKATVDGAIKFQRNTPDDLELEEVLSKVTRTEREPIDEESLKKLKKKQ